MFPVGPSTDSGGVTMVDSIKVFTKTKEAFGWPEEPDEFTERPKAKVTPPVTATTSNNESEMTVATMTYMPLTSADKYVFYIVQLFYSPNY